MMQRLGGYTIVEVLIVLAVSGVLLAASIAAFRGQQAETEYSQAIADIQSKFQSYSSQVSSATIPSGYTCAPTYDSTLNREFAYLSPLTTQTADSTSNQACIFLGQLIQIVPGANTLYTYPVLGLRTIYNGTTDTGEFPSTPNQSNPELAQDGNGNLLLNSSYTLLNGAKIVSAKINSTENDILMLYQNLQDANTSGNEVTAYSRAYTSTQADVNSDNLLPCVEGRACGGAITPLGSNIWKLCLARSDGSHQMQLSIQNSATGLTTKTVEGCS